MEAAGDAHATVQQVCGNHKGNGDASDFPAAPCHRPLRPPATGRYQLHRSGQTLSRTLPCVPSQVISYLLDHNFLLTALELLQEASEAGASARCHPAAAAVLAARRAAPAAAAARQLPPTPPRLPPGTAMRRPRLKQLSSAPLRCRPARAGRGAGVFLQGPRAVPAGSGRRLQPRPRCASRRLLGCLGWVLAASL